MAAIGKSASSPENPLPIEAAGCSAHATTPQASQTNTPKPTEQSETAQRSTAAVHSALLALARAMGRQAAREDIARHRAAMERGQHDVEAL